ncbi:MAG TPA: CehA/McbA family metallohydrolase, partial [bacterium]
GINDLGAVSLHRVVDTSGYLSGDFHVHSVNSSDAPIPLIDRVMTFAGEGVEILVATDHDYITDYRPVIEELNLQEFVNSVIGNEVTTWDFGHFNAFPLTPDTSKPANGALDWGNGTGYTMTPCQIMDGMLDDPGEEIVQVNHPRGSAVFQAYFSAIQLDTLTRKTYATPEIFRMPPDLAKFIGWSPLAKDTGLFYGKFTAMEIYNNYGDIDTLLNDWFTFLNTGLIVTGTGVSDTHTKVATSAGVPRTFTKMPTDTPSRMNDHDLVANVNTQKVVVSNGPFLIVEVENSAGQTAGSGDLLYSNGNDINLKIRIQSPTWIKYDAIKIFSNTGETATGDDGTLNSRSPAPIKEYKLGTDFALDSSAEVVADGGRRYEVNIAGKFSISRDAWFIVQVKTESEEYGLFPLSFNNGEKPLSISNPVFVTVENDNDFDPPGATRRTGLSGAATKNTIQQLRASTIEEIGRLSKIIDKKK